MRKITSTLMTVILLLFSSLALADYITPEGNVEIAEGVYARESAAKEIRRYNATYEVVKLYHQDINDIDETLTLVRSKNNCIILQINTKGKVKNFINQVFITDEFEECLK